MIINGWVAVHGHLCEDPRADFPTEGLVFTVDGETWVWRERVYLMLHKPPGYECSRAPQRHPSVLQLLPQPLQRRGVQPVGRLDQDTSGVLLLSDDGAFIHRISSPRHHVPKTYRAGVRHTLDEAMLQRLRDGVQLHGEDGVFAASGVERIDELTLRLTLHQGIYHQVKRMLAAAGNRCESLHREAVGGLQLGDLQPGQWRYVETEELEGL